MRTLNRLPRGGFALVQAILPFVAVVMEFCWAYPWVMLLTGVFYGSPPAPLLPPWPAFALLGLGFLTVSTALARPWSLKSVRILVTATGVVAGLIAVKTTYYPWYAVSDLRWLPVLLRAAHDALPVVVPAVMGAVTAALLWWRGVVLGEREFNYFEIDRGFRRGIAWSVLFVLLLAIYGDTRGFAIAQPAPVYLLAFFSLSLTTLAIARLLAIWQETHADEGQALSMNRHWVLLLIGVVGLIFLAATVISGIVHLQMRPVLLRLLRPLEPVVEFLFLIVFAVAMVVARVIIFVLSHLPFRGAVTPPSSTLSRPLSEILKDLPPHIVSGVRWGMVLLIVAALITLVAIAVVRAQRRPRRKDEDERESVWSTGAVLSGVGAAWHALWARLRRRPDAPQVPAVGAIRAIYHEMLRLGAALGIPRQKHQTPYEYRPRLCERLPESESDIDALTDAYIRVRYTPHIPGDSEIAETQWALDRIRNRVRGNEVAR